MILTKLQSYKQNFIAVFAVTLFAVATYCNSFYGPFVLDDLFFITKNEIITNLDNFFVNSGGYRFNPPRYIGVLSIALNYHWGGLNVIGYHIFNLLVHIGCGILVYLLFRLTFRTTYFELAPKILLTGAEEGPKAPIYRTFYFYNFYIPLFAALLFVTHPIQTQAVTYIAQRFTSLMSFFYLLSLTSYIQGRLQLEFFWSTTQNFGNNSSNTSKSFYKKKFFIGVICLTGSVVFAVLAMKTKESSFTLPLTIVLYEIFFFRGGWLRRLSCLLPLLATLPIVPLSKFSLGVSSANIISQVDTQIRAQSDLSRLDYLFTQFRVIVTYLRLLFFPVNQNLDYDYPVYRSFFSEPVLLSFLFLSSIMSFGVFLYVHSRVGCVSDEVKSLSFQDLTTPTSGFKKDEIRGNSKALWRLVSFGIFWFFLTLSVESSLIPIADVIVEHRLYLPSIGIALAFSSICAIVHLRTPSLVLKKLILIFSLVIVLGLSSATYQRNHIWQDDIGLWKDVVDKSPQNPRAYNNLGYVLNKAGKPWEAIPYFNEAIELAPYYADANYNLARSYLMIGQSSLAIPLLQKTLNIEPKLSNAYSDLGAALNNEGLYTETVKLLEGNLDRLTRIPEAHFNLGVAYANLGRQVEARRELASLSVLDDNLAKRLAQVLTDKFR